jgi:hypothetical protein
VRLIKASPRAYWRRFEVRREGFCRRESEPHIRLDLDPPRPRSARLACRTRGRRLNITEPDAKELDDPIERADDEFDRLKEEAEQRADRTAQVKRELEGDEEIPGRP